MHNFRILFRACFRLEILICGITIIWLVMIGNIFTQPISDDESVVWPEIKSASSKLIFMFIIQGETM